MKQKVIYIEERPTKVFKDGYISYTNEKGWQESEWFGGTKMVDGVQKQVPVTKAQLRKRAKELEKLGYKIGIVEMAYYRVEVENGYENELVDPFKTEDIF